MIELKLNEKMEPVEHYPQNSKSHCITSYCNQITLHYFQCPIFALRLVRSDLSLAILKARTPLLTFIIHLKIQLFWFPANQCLKKVILALFLKVDKISNVSEKTTNQNTSFTFSLKRTMYSPFIFIKTLTDLLAIWC